MCAKKIFSNASKEICANPCIFKIMKHTPVWELWLMSLLLALPSCGQQQIVVHPYGYWYKGDTTFAEFTELDRDSTLYRLFDEQYLKPFYSDVPRSAPQVRYAPQKYYPLRGVLDLGGRYALSDIYYYDANGVDSFYIYYGEPDHWFLLLATTDYYNKWVHLQVHIQTRYLYFILTGQQSVVKEILLYGNLIGKRLSSRPVVHHTYPLPTIGEEMGMVSFNDFPYPPQFSIGTWFRNYENMPWIDTSVYEHDINKIHFVFDRFSDHSRLVHYAFPDTQHLTYFEFPYNALVNSGKMFQAHGKEKWLSIQGSLPINPWEDMPVDRFAHPGARLSDPAVYDRVARMAYLFGVVMGRGHAPDPYHQILFPDSLHQQAYRAVEDGNERDADWIAHPMQADAYFAYASMFDDGNGAPPASLLGVKNADPQMKHIMFGTYYMDSNFVKALNYYMYYRRKDHKKFIDVYNFHHYAFIRNQHAISPEQDSLRQKIKRYVDFIHNLDPGKEVWYTEWGYDRNRKSDLAVPVIPGVDSATLQAWWIIRAELAIAFTGVKVNTLFQMRNDGQQQDYDSSGIHRFNTTGVMDDYRRPDGVMNYSAYPVYYYLSTFYHLMFYYRADAIIREHPGDSVWIYRFRNAVHPDSVIYAIWCPTSANKIIASFHFHLKPHIQIETVRLKDKSFTGERNVLQTDAYGNIQLHITENPLFVLTTENVPASRTSNMTQ